MDSRGEASSVACIAKGKRMGAEIQDGAVLVARAILNSSLWTMRAEDKVVAITCIAIANWKDGKWFDGTDEIPIKRGQFVRSWAGLAEESGESVQTVRTSVQHLEKVGFLTRKSTGRYHVFTIPKYSHYQDLTKYSDAIAAKSNRIPNSPLTGTQQDINSSLTTNNKGIREEGNNGGEDAPLASSPIGLLITEARSQSLIYSNERQLRIMLNGWVARRGFQIVQELLMSGKVKGWDIMEINKVYFKASGVAEHKNFVERRDSHGPPKL